MALACRDGRAQPGLKTRAPPGSDRDRILCAGKSFLSPRRCLAPIGARAADLATVSGDSRYDLVWQEQVWEKAAHRVVTEDITPEQAVDEAIARIKEILSE
jgi:hypothetical protein